MTLGVLRALESLELIPLVDAISSVSGGTWASSIYMFAKDVSVKDVWVKRLRIMITSVGSCPANSQRVAGCCKSCDCAEGSPQELLGEDTVPNDLTLERLKRQPPRLGVPRTRTFVSLQFFIVSASFSFFQLVALCSMLLLLRMWRPPTSSPCSGAILSLPSARSCPDHVPHVLRILRGTLLLEPP